MIDACSVVKLNIDLFTSPECLYGMFIDANTGE